MKTNIKIIPSKFTPIISPNIEKQQTGNVNREMSPFKSQTVQVNNQN